METHDFGQMLAELTVKPEPWAPGAPGLWTDPHISLRMLAAHLDPTTDAASRPPETIDATVSWLSARLGLGTGSRVLDLGCGPGLYTRRLGALGCAVTGVDYSQRSIEYAREHDPAGTYLLQDYRMLNVEGPFDAASLVYGDLCVLPPAEADRLLRTIHGLLTPGGWFAFDVTTPTLRAKVRQEHGWSAHPDGGFWRSDPYLLATTSHHYAHLDLSVDQYAVFEADGRITVYRNWFRDYDAAAITDVVEAAGFEVVGLYADLAGTALAGEDDWIGVIARKA
ncbi:MAG: cyclopropane-fatty-acyl-phospholipid synthase family protein [Dehalococcoidia bacterium]